LQPCSKRTLEIVAIIPGLSGPRTLTTTFFNLLSPPSLQESRRDANFTKEFSATMRE